ncbi:MAG: iron donor protein CyaY [Deltaproteobacteria bacterium]|nr:iron donor protein CyaY [Deltaproteobacteria bacterium]
MSNPCLSEKEYREILKQTFDQIEAAFVDIDPDAAECEQSLGSMTISFQDGSKCVFSAQPSVRQLWVAIASKGLAYHFNYDFDKHEWLDDKGRGIEFKALLKSYLKEMTGVDFKL